MILNGIGLILVCKAKYAATGHFSIVTFHYMFSLSIASLVCDTYQDIYKNNLIAMHIKYHSQFEYHWNLFAMDKIKETEFSISRIQSVACDT